MSNHPPWLKRGFRHTFFGSETLEYDHIRSVTGRQLLLDSIINFYFLYLQKEKFRDKDFLFLCPNVLMIVQFMDEEIIIENLEPLEISKKSVIFISINNNMKTTGACGGSHWSLLVYVRKMNKYFYFDSLENCNLSFGRNYMKKFHPFISPESKIKKDDNELIVVKNLQQQPNGYDCGVFTVAYAEKFAETLDINKIERIDSTKFRKHILDLIEFYWKK